MNKPHPLSWSEMEALLLDKLYPPVKKIHVKLFIMYTICALLQKQNNYNKRKMKQVAYYCIEERRALFAIISARQELIQIFFL